jgi:uncharacterized protein (DUF1810 family)
VDHGLERFVTAQAPVYDSVCAELARGRKTSHWMWFIFPQLAALGRSPTAKYFGIASLAEAQAYWQHPVLGPRLAHCTELIVATSGRSAHEIFGSPDDLKLRSCMTLFSRAAIPADVLERALDKFFDGVPDPSTIELLG